MIAGGADGAIEPSDAATSTPMPALARCAGSAVGAGPLSVMKRQRPITTWSGAPRRCSSLMIAGNAFLQFSAEAIGVDVVAYQQICRTPHESDNDFDARHGLAPLPECRRDRRKPELTLP
jgi:hypothetical protein